MEDLLEQQEFYELMQTYRHINISNQLGAVYAFEQVKKFIKDNFEPKKANPVENRVSQKNAEGLLPCPFCGYEAEIRIRGTQHNSMIIACTHCGGKIESGDVYGLTKPEHYHWNKRI